MAVCGCPLDTRPHDGTQVAGDGTRDTPTELANETNHSPATGLTSRRNVERAFAAAMTQQERQVLAILDVDHFRLFKNLHGTAIGDALLRSLSRRLDAASSAAGGSLLRLGADEFAILIPVCGIDADIFSWARALLEEASAPLSYRGAVVRFSATLGFAFLPDQGGTFEDALHCARLAVAEGKAAGGGVSVPCSNVLVAAARGRDALTRELRGAIAAGQMVPFYQPVIALGTGKVTGLEVLARWMHPLHGLLMPSVFIPLAEEQGLCGDLTRCLLRRVQQDARNWPRHWHFAFNTTPRDVVDLLAFIEGPWGIGHDTIDPARIELEVTETAVMRDLTESSDLLATFRSRGVRLVLDDFGTGYANFQQLRQIPFARLKIDKSFIVDMLEDPRAAACVQAIIQLAHHLGMTATAEGVEVAAIADRLSAMACDHAQGYYYARPMPAAEVARLSDVPLDSGGGLDHAA